MKGMITNWLACWGSYTQSGHLEFAPQHIHSFITLSKISGDGMAYAYFTSYRYQLPSGAPSPPVPLHNATQFHADKVMIVNFAVTTWSASAEATVVVTLW